MVASLRASVGTGKNEDESFTGRVWAAVFHHVTARSGLEHVFMDRLFLYFSYFFFPGRGQPRLTDRGYGGPPVYLSLTKHCTLWS